MLRVKKVTSHYPQVAAARIKSDNGGNIAFAKVVVER